MSSGQLCTQSGSPIAWETIVCPLCGSSSEDEVLAVPAERHTTRYRLARCRDCGMVYLNPRPDEKSLIHLYPEDYEPYQAPVPRSAGRCQHIGRRLQALVLSQHFGYPPPLQRWHEKLLAGIAKPWFSPSSNSLTDVSFHGQGRLLDYGCGSGWYAQRMRDRGWHVTGMDFSAHAAHQVEQRWGIQVLVGTLPHQEVKAESFDMISMGAVLEHVHDPHQVIGAACRALRTNGRLLVAVPNLGGWGFRFFGRDWYGLDLPRHLLHFTPTTLRRLVEGHGLEVRELDTVVRAGWLRRSLTNARRTNSPVSRRLLAQLGRARLLSSLMARWTGWTRQADCIRLVAYKANRGASRGTRVNTKKR
jgi:SAM-dependent methyltransferase